MAVTLGHDDEAWDRPRTAYFAAVALGLILTAVVFALLVIMGLAAHIHAAPALHH